LEAALNEPKHRLRQWIESLPPLSSRTTRPRSASEFYVADLRFLFVIQGLIRAGLSLDSLQPISEALYRAIQQPIEAGQYPVLTMHFQNGWQLDASAAAEGLKLEIPLRPAWEAVDACLGTSNAPLQYVIGLGLRSVGNKRGLSSNE
jgi:hypothetical protein